MQKAVFRNNKKFNKVIASVLALGLFVGSMAGQAPVEASESIKVKINGNQEKFEVAPRIVQGTTMLPFRGVAEKLGAKATWDAKTKKVTVKKGSKVIELVMGKKEAVINGKKITLAAAPVIISGSTLVPLRVISEGLDYKVNWVAGTKTILIGNSGVVNIYTSRHYGVEPVFTEFTKQTGIKVRFTTGGDAVLRERLKAEDKNTPADIYMAVDAGNLWLAAEEGLLQTVNSPVLNGNIPSNAKDDENRWFGFTKRVRTIMYNPDKVKASEISSYEDLADPKWKGRLILRNGTHVYNQSLVANLMATHGTAKAESIVKGWVANNPKIMDSDTRILETLAAGGGDVAITNHYYLGRLLEKNPSFPIKVLFADQDGKGVHANISGAGVTTHADNKDNAILLLEWLSGGKGQKMFAESNHEFPTNPKVAPHKIIAGFGSFKENDVKKSEFGRLQAEAVKLLEKAGFK